MCSARRASECEFILHAPRRGLDYIQLSHSSVPVGWAQIIVNWKLGRGGSGSKFFSSHAPSSRCTTEYSVPSPSLVKSSQEEKKHTVKTKLVMEIWDCNKLRVLINQKWFYLEASRDLRNEIVWRAWKWKSNNLPQMSSREWEVHITKLKSKTCSAQIITIQRHCVRMRLWIIPLTPLYLVPYSLVPSAVLAIKTKERKKFKGKECSTKKISGSPCCHCVLLRNIFNAWFFTSDVIIADKRFKNSTFSESFLLHFLRQFFFLATRLRALLIRWEDCNPLIEHREHIYCAKNCLRFQSWHIVTQSLGFDVPFEVNMWIKSTARTIDHVNCEW